VFSIPTIFTAKIELPLVVEVKCGQLEGYISVATSVLLNVLYMEFIE
jgi:hypothetical protein